MLGTIFECRSEEFQHLKQIYEKRWGELTAFMATLEPLLTILRAAWDERKYKVEGEGRRQRVRAKRGHKGVGGRLFPHLFVYAVVAGRHP